MEVNHQELNEDRWPATIPMSEAAALDIIRTETVLSRLPIHNLSKKGNVNIQILKTGADGKVELKWIVSYSDRYGQARQLAYKLDTIVINNHIDEQGRPLPKMICLGSLRDVADQLDLGGDTNKVRRALRQNASAFITAKFEYRGKDGTKKTLEADFTRYSVVFTGEQLPDGRRADAVYIILNEPYREVLNNAPVRPLDRAYMKLLPPAAQRFYEIISYKIFSAIKNDYVRANISYSEYCTYSAQLRHFERQRVQDQMAKVIRPHKVSGYISAVKYEPTIDAESKPDWIIYFTPGPKARTEFAAAHTRRKTLRPADVTAPERGDNLPKLRRSDPRTQQSDFERTSPQPSFDPVLVSEMTRRGINEKKAHNLLSNLKPGQDKNLIAQLEHAEEMVRQSQSTAYPIRNPAGFIIHLIELNTPVPEGFETKAQREAREERERKERAHRDREEARQQLEWDYDDYRAAEVDRYIAEHASEFEALRASKLVQERGEHRFGAETMARISARQEIHKRLAFLTFEEFVERKKQGTDFPLKPVGPSPAAKPYDPPEEEDLLTIEERRDAEMARQVATETQAEGKVAADADQHRETHDPAEKSEGTGTESAAETAVIESTHETAPEGETVELMAIEVREEQPSASIDAESTKIPEETIEPGPLTIEFVSDPPQDEFEGPPADAQAA